MVWDKINDRKRMVVDVVFITPDFGNFASHGKSTFGRCFRSDFNYAAWKAGWSTV